MLLVVRWGVGGKRKSCLYSYETWTIQIRLFGQSPQGPYNAKQAQDAEVEVDLHYCCNCREAATYSMYEVLSVLLVPVLPQLLPRYGRHDMTVRSVIIIKKRARTSRRSRLTL